MTPDELEVLILEGRDDGALAEAFAPLDESERSKLSPAVQKIHRQLYRNKADDRASDRLKRFLANRAGEMWQYFQAAETRRARLALFALCPVSVLTRSDVFLMGDDIGTFDRIVRDRRPDWLVDWIGKYLEREFVQLDFATLRGWIRDGICPKPEADGYYRMFASYLMRTGMWSRETKAPPPLSTQLLDDPDLLADVDGLFRVENEAFNTNAWLRKNAASHYESWTEALIKLSAQGHIGRGHLLGLALDGLKLDLKQNQLSGFHGLYRAMAPSLDEQIRHQPLYVDLLCHKVGHVVKFALDMLASLEKQGALDSGPVLREIGTVFAGDGKGNAVAALKLIRRLIGRDEGKAALALACEGLFHAHADVQSLALDIVEANSALLDESGLDALRRAEALVSASNRPRVSKLLASAVPAAGIGDVAAAADTRAEGIEAIPDYRPISGDLNEQKVLFPEDALVPIGSADELIDAIAHALEVVDSPDEVERIIDAISRFAHDRPADLEARAAPLLHRVQTGAPGSNGMMIGRVGVGLALLDLLHSWLTGKHYRTPDPRLDYYILEDAFVPIAGHLRAINERVARWESRLLLSAPTHKGGWIDPLVWVERLAAVQDDRGTAGSMDFRLSLLRLAPDNRAAALELARTLDPPLRRIADFALGGDERPARADRALHAAWICAARCRAPKRDWSDEFAPLGLDDRWPDGLKPALYSWRSSHKEQKYENLRWKIPEFALSIECGGAPAESGKPGIFGRIALAASGRIATDWPTLPTAALNRLPEKRQYWSGELGTIWVSQWLAYVWPQNPAAACFKGISRLVERMDENSSNWTPGFGYFNLLFQRGRPWGEAGHLLLCIGLVGKDADAKGLAVDALIEGIEARLFDPDLFASTIARLAEGEWIKPNRLGDSLMSVIQVSGLHAAVVSDALQKWLPQLDLSQKNAFRLLEVLVEARALTGRPLGEEARDALRGVEGSGKAAKIARQLLDA